MLDDVEKSVGLNSIAGANSIELVRRFLCKLRDSVQDLRSNLNAQVATQSRAVGAHLSTSAKPHLRFDLTNALPGQQS